MANVKISWTIAGFREIRTSMAEGEVMAAAHAVAARAGADYAVEGYATGGKGRWRAIIFPTTYKAMRDNQKNNTLLKALH